MGGPACTVGPSVGSSHRGGEAIRLDLGVPEALARPQDLHALLVGGTEEPHPLVGRSRAQGADEVGRIVRPPGRVETRKCLLHGRDEAQAVDHPLPIAALVATGAGEAADDAGAQHRVDPFGAVPQHREVGPCPLGQARVGRPDVTGAGPEVEASEDAPGQQVGGVQARHRQGHEHRVGRREHLIEKTDPGLHEQVVVRTLGVGMVRGVAGHPGRDQPGKAVRE